MPVLPLGLHDRLDDARPTTWWSSSRAGSTGATTPPSIFAQDLTLPDITEGPRGPVVVTMEHQRATTGRSSSSRPCSASHPGVTEVHLRLSQPGRSVLMKLDDSYRVNATEALFGDLKVILGPRCLAG